MTKPLSLLFNAGMVLVAVYLFTLTSQFPSPSNPNIPGPAYFPRLMLGLLVILLIADGIRTLLQRRMGPFFSDEEKKGLKKWLYIIGVVLLFVFTLGRLPFLPVMAVVIFAMCKLLQLNWKGSILTTVILSLLVYLIFIKGFHVMI
ncbi:tripartite tricarboxylate transporter TctB family protein [Desmospora activa]|uniref:Tripartite tricarboxylate transporter TctB family protein n=1 Tax=Desmospora activa DSM 45169 TaxID=1121389 RepID=A0A2T4ZBR1_9BACL|nr:tripartite tricarboxylate transporter TctB family protein [Desmospora activa]PTM59329.1 tripartite tricarboxylate transporter TctB family protein [Desmospora activa DSM 45169]